MSDFGNLPSAGLPDIALDAVLRRLSGGGPNMLSIDLVTGERFPTSGAFQPDDDGVSVFREGVLTAARLQAADIVKAPQNLVVRLPMAAVREVDPLDVADDPWPNDVPDPDNPCYVGHALIIGWDGLTKNPRRARQRELARHPQLQFVYG